MSSFGNFLTDCVHLVCLFGILLVHLFVNFGHFVCLFGRLFPLYVCELRNSYTAAEVSCVKVSFSSLQFPSACSGGIYWVFHVTHTLLCKVL